MPLVLRTLLVLLFLDLLVGIWMRLHAEHWLSFFVTHLPVLALAGVAWGVVPDASRSWLRDAARRVLEDRTTRVGLATLTLVLGVLSLLCSSVRVESVEPNARTQLRLVTGDRTRADSSRLASARPAPLNRLTTPVSFRVWLPPVGARMWVHAPGMATADRRVLPWVPARFQYPDDFDSLGTLAVVPMPRLYQLTLDTLGAPVLVVRAATDGALILATDTLTRLRPVLVGFPEQAPPDTSTIGDWRDRLRLAFTDTTQVLDEQAVARREEDVAAMLAEWREPHTIASAQPLVLGDVLRWELRRRDGTILSWGTTRMTHVVTSIYLDP